MNYTKKISILGCGWTGFALKELLESKGHSVHCLSRDIDLNILEQFYVADVLVIAIPPSAQDYLEVLDRTMSAFDEGHTTQIIFLSSISFYDGKASVVEAERRIQALVTDVVVLRLGGLMGYDRVAGKYTAGKVLTSDSRTNYVHRDDVLGIIERIIEEDIRGEVFDVVAPVQSTKKVIFSQNAKKFGFKETEFLNGDQVGKVLSPLKLIDLLNYVFIKEDVHTF